MKMIEQVSPTLYPDRANIAQNSNTGIVMQQIIAKQVSKVNKLGKLQFFNSLFSLLGFATLPLGHTERPSLSQSSARPGGDHVGGLPWRPCDAYIGEPMHTSILFARNKYPLSLRVPRSHVAVCVCGGPGGPGGLGAWSFA